MLKKTLTADKFSYCLSPRYLRWRNKSYIVGHMATTTKRSQISGFGSGFKHLEYLYIFFCCPRENVAYDFAISGPYFYPLTIRFHRCAMVFLILHKHIISDWANLWQKLLFSLFVATVMLKIRVFSPVSGLHEQI